MELLDVVDEKDRITGKILDRETIHENGLWHRQATCWIMNKEGKLLFQKRSKLKSHNPSKWSRTGGHIDAGEEVLDGIIREIKEEIGVNIPKEKLKLIQKEPFEKEYINKKTKHRYWAYDYFTIVDYKLSDYTMQKEEVDDLKYISIEEMEELKKKNNSEYTFVKWENVEQIIEMIKKITKEKLGF